MIIKRVKISCAPPSPLLICSEFLIEIIEGTVNESECKHVLTVIELNTSVAAVDNNVFSTMKSQICSKASSVLYSR